MQDEDFKSRDFNSSFLKTPILNDELQSSSPTQFRQTARVVLPPAEESADTHAANEQVLVDPSSQFSSIRQHGKNQDSGTMNQQELVAHLQGIDLNPGLVSTREAILHDDSIVCIGVDCETNSLTGPMLELAAMNYSTGKMWSTLINPGQIKFNSAAYQIHGISQEMVQAPGVPTSAEACSQFMTWLNEQSGGEEMVIVGYNSIV